MRKWIALLAMFMPWAVKRQMLQKLLGYRLHATARIEFAYVNVGYLEMAEGSRICRFSICKNVDRIVLKESAKIGRYNQVTCIPSKNKRHFVHIENRSTSLTIGCHSTTTMFHLLDCNQAITIGDFSTIAGYGSQLLTHSIDIRMGRQDAEPITIGDYCFVGTNCVIIGGANLPDRSVLGAKSMLNKSWTDESMVYGGVPARPVSSIPEDAAYMNRKVGHVD